MTTTDSPRQARVRRAGGSLAAVLAVLATLLGGAGTASAVTPTIPTQVIPLGNEWNGPVAVDQAKRVLYAAQSGGGGTTLTIETVDTTTNRVTGQIPLTFVPSEMVVDPSTHLLYLSRPGNQASGFGPGSVVELDPATGATRTTPTGGSFDANAIAIDPSSRTLYVTSGADAGIVSVIDLATFTATAQVGGIGPRLPSSIVVDTTTHVALVTTLGSVAVVDTRTNTVVDRLLPSRSNDFVSRVALNPVTHTAYYVSSLVGSQGPSANPTLHTYDTTARRIVSATYIADAEPLFELVVDPGTGLLHATTGGAYPAEVTVDPIASAVVRSVTATGNLLAPGGRRTGCRHHQSLRLLHRCDRPRRHGAQHHHPDRGGTARRVPGGHRSDRNEVHRARRLHRVPRAGRPAPSRTRAAAR